MKNKSNVPDLPKELKIKCNAIIHSASVAAGGVGTGLAQIPLADNAVITPIQITMIISLGKVFGQDITTSAAKGILGGVATSIIGRGVSQLLWGWIPVLGNTINTATAAGLTEAIGWFAVKHFMKDYKITPNFQENQTNNDESIEFNRDESIKFINRDELIERATKILSTPFSTGQASDYYTLLDDMEKFLDEYPQDTEIKDLYNKVKEHGPNP